MPPKVFISYSRKDSEDAGKLVELLRSESIEVWKDVEQIAPGQNWQQAIDKGLSGSTAIVVVLSSNSVDSAWIWKEVEVMHRAGKTIIPVLIDDTPLGVFPQFVQELQVIDARSLSAEQKLTLVSQLKAYASATPQAPPQQKSKGYVFLSYTIDDLDFVEELRIFLANNGYAYWDYNESDRDYQAQLFQELETAIMEAAGTLSILSNAWKRSRWTVKEMLFSQQVGTPVFLLRAKDMGPSIIIADLHWIDFTHDKAAGFARLRRELDRRGL